MKSRISPKDWILLSSYLDDELDARDKARVEARLKAMPAFQDALECLRCTKELLSRMPALGAPRNFTLPAYMAKTEPSSALRLVPALRWSSAVAALIAVFFMVSTLLGGLPFRMQMAAAPADMAAKETVSLMAESEPAAAEEAAEPPVIYWNGPPVREVYGLGGGAADGIGGAEEITVPPAVIPTQPVQVFKVQPTEAPLAEVAPQPTPTIVATAPQHELPVEGSGPILGIAPTERQGEMLPETERQVLPLVASGSPAQEEQVRKLPLFGIIGIGLFIVAAGLFLTAFILRKKALR